MSPVGHLLVSQRQLVAKFVATFIPSWSFFHIYAIFFIVFNKQYFAKKKKIDKGVNIRLIFLYLNVVSLFVRLQPWRFLLVLPYDRTHQLLCLGLLRNRKDSHSSSLSVFSPCRLHFEQSQSQRKGKRKVWLKKKITTKRKVGGGGT